MSPDPKPMPEPQDIAALRETAEALIAELPTSEDGTGHIVDCGYIEEIPQCGCYTLPGRLGGIVAPLLSEVERGRALRAAVEALADEFHEVAQSITNLDAASLGRQSVWQSCSRQTRALLAAHVPSPLAEVQDDRERRGAL